MYGRVQRAIKKADGTPCFVKFINKINMNDEERYEMREQINEMIEVKHKNLVSIDRLFET